MRAALLVPFVVGTFLNPSVSAIAQSPETGPREACFTASSSWQQYEACLFAALPSEGGLPAALPVRVTADDGSSTITVYDSGTWKGTSFTKPEKGNRLVTLLVGQIAADAGVKNNPLGWYVLDDEGFSYEGESSGKEPMTPTTELRPGQEYKGWLTFEMPEGARVVTLVYDYAGQIIYIDLTSPEPAASVVP